MSGERVGREPDPYFESKPGGQDDRPIFNHAKIKLLQSDERPVPARIDTASWLDWRVGILLALPFFIAFGWAPGHWPGAAVNPGATEVCDGFDNDCDGSVDEDFVSTATSCGVGACASTGITSCVPSSAPEGQFVRVTLPTAQYLSLAEVEVYSGGFNVAPGGT
ncbi:MAG: putative metal-binding motif-containing protein, partial [Nitrospinae bacterium]|nr:putative metal-binding motif-containing protein [Nitrospinota bacterium]